MDKLSDRVVNFSESFFLSKLPASLEHSLGFNCPRKTMITILIKAEEEEAVKVPHDLVDLTHSSTHIT